MTILSIFPDIHAADLTASRDFYVDLLGLQVAWSPTGTSRWPPPMRRAHSWPSLLRATPRSRRRTAAARPGS